MYDAIIIGARCAGASTAMLLARKGYKVLLADRATFPSDIPQGHFIHKHGPGRLHRWGLLDRVVSTSCPPVTSTTWDADDFPLVGRELMVDGVAMGYGPRRSALDNVLVEAAVEAGAELREGFVIEDFPADGERVGGIRARDKRGGAVTTEWARVTIGADGRNSASPGPSKHPHTSTLLLSRAGTSLTGATSPTATAWRSTSGNAA